MMTPIFSTDAIERSQHLTHLIRDDIVNAGGAIPFSYFMSRALYTPVYGYYMADNTKLGSAGDFLTAPEISPLLAEALAKQCQSILATISSGDILEVGAGTGVLAVELLLALERENSVPAHYFIFDISPDCRRRQKELLTTRCPHLLSCVVWLEVLPATPIQGVIIANEVLDALPVDCFEITENGCQERGVAWEDDHFVWKCFPFRHSERSEESLHWHKILRFAQDDNIGYRSEIHRSISDWIRSVSTSLDKGVIFLIDYGYPRKEYYHPDRSMGTLMCYCQHQRSDNPFDYVGLQDITAHVDFTLVIESAVAAGCSLAGFTTQAGFLLSSGLIEKNGKESAVDQFRYATHIKKLMMPHEMGEAIKVMALSKQYDVLLAGFDFQDRRWDL